MNVSLPRLICSEQNGRSSEGEREIVNADHHGYWTQMFGGKALETGTSGPVVKCNFYLYTCISLAHCSGLRW